MSNKKDMSVKVYVKPIKLLFKKKNSFSEITSLELRLTLPNHIWQNTLPANFRK